MMAALEIVDDKKVCESLSVKFQSAKPLYLREPGLSHKLKKERVKPDNQTYHSALIDQKSSTLGNHRQCKIQHNILRK